jgi:hypothetical protein
MHKEDPKEYSYKGKDEDDQDQEEPATTLCRVNDVTWQL